MFVQKLKGIISKEIAETLSDYSIKLDFSENPSKSYNIDKPKKCLVIFINNLTPKEKRNLKSAILADFNHDTIELVEAGEKQELLDRLYKYNNKEDNQILAFFKPILSVIDWNALRDSLFLRNEFKLGNPVGNFKKDIVMRYGERGNTISNLCTAGYFEQTMIPLYNANETHSEFYKYWDIAVDKGCTALFVNVGMTVDKINYEIERRLKSAKNYGQQFIHIHGIGDKNIKKINDCISKENRNASFKVKNIFSDDKLHVLVVEVIL